MGIKKIKDIDNTGELLESLNQISSKKINIGLLGDADSKMLTIGNVQEFGCQIKVTPKMRAYLNSIGIHLKNNTKYINIPERSFIRAGFESGRNDLEETVKRYLKYLFAGKISQEKFFEMTGIRAKDLIKDYMTDLRKPPLHPVTKQRKGSSHPLIDTGHLRDTVDFEVK